MREDMRRSITFSMWRQKMAFAAHLLAEERVLAPDIIGLIQKGNIRRFIAFNLAVLRTLGKTII